MAQAKHGDLVKVNYTGRLEDGTVFDTCVGKKPLEFKIGDGKIIEGFEQGVIGMHPGDKKLVKIPPDKAYGPRRKDRIMQVPRSQFPAGSKLSVGQPVEAKQPNGQVARLMVVAIDTKHVTLDANHPLAGRTINFEIELLEIAPKI